MSDKKPRQLWVEALRSGEYHQARGQLQNVDAYCCLGVACRVAEKHGVEVNQQLGFLDGTCLIAQPNVKEWLGLASGKGDLKNVSLALLNDAERLSFSDIADIIEQNAGELFIEESGE